MRRKLIWLVMLLALWVFTASGAHAAVWEPDVPAVPCESWALPANAVLPSSLTVIEESAFEGTALRNVQLPGSLAEIGDRAFADIPALQLIAMPDSLVFIGNEVLADDPLVIVEASTGSYARKWALRNGYRFSPIAMYCAGSFSPQTVGAPDRGELTSAPETEAIGTFIPTGRPMTEIRAYACTGRLASMVRGRYFP